MAALGLQTVPRTVSAKVRLLPSADPRGYFCFGSESGPFGVSEAPLLSIAKQREIHDGMALFGGWGSKSPC